MAVGLALVLVAVLCGLAVQRALRAPLSLAPLSGLASMAVLTTWASAAGAPPLARAGLIVIVALAGLVVGARELPRLLATPARQPLATAILCVAVSVPALMLGVAFAGVGAPVSTHDGAFHVELIDSLRRGQPIQGWYPIGFHGSVAAVLGLTPWVDTARGTLEAGLGLALLAPLAVFAFGLALELDRRIAAIGALILGVTWTYPYDYQLWAGWPQGMGILLLLGLCATAARWITRPSIRLAMLAGLFAGSIVISHGTEVYSATLLLGVIAVMRWRQLNLLALSKHLPVALGLGILITGPYISTLLGWAAGGGATAVGEAVAASPDTGAPSDVLQFVTGVTGGGSLLDLPVRLALIGLGLGVARVRSVATLWASVVALLLVIDLVDLPPVKTVFAVTYPWLDHNRPQQIAVVFASLLAANGIWVCAGYLGQVRLRIARHPDAWRRIAIGCALVTFFFAEGSGVSIYKRLVQAIDQQNVYSSDAAAAMAWLRGHADTGEMVANDMAGDAGIWAPYKADVPILLPRSAPGVLVDARQPLLENLIDLTNQPTLQAQACALRVDYVFHSAAPQAFDERTLPDTSALERAPDLEEVFSSGQASVFRIRLPCNQAMTADPTATF